MHAMIWKEIRQNLVWSVLLLLGLGAAMGWAVGTGDIRRPEDDLGRLVCGHSFLLVTEFLFPVAAFLLALLQTRPELGADRWALLVHRPLSRAAIFRAKVVAGLGLYLAVTSVPFLLAAWWTAVPGHLAAPFVPAMLYPGMADIGLGLPFYFAGLLHALLPGRWYGGRALPLAGALGFPFWAHIGSDSFWAAAFFLGCLALLAGAARRAFLECRLDRPVSGSRRLLFASAFAPGLIVLAFVVLAIMFLVADGLVPREGRRMLEIAPDGTAFLQVSRPQANGTYDVDDLDLDGAKLPPLPAEEGGRSPTRPTLPLVLWNLGERESHLITLHDAERYVIACDEGEKTPTIWYLLPEEGLYAGFTRRDRCPAGWFGPGGMTPLRPATPHSIALGNNIWHWGQGRLPGVHVYTDGVFVLDPARSATTRLVGPEEVARVVETRSYAESNEEPVSQIFVDEGDHLLVFSPQGKRLASLPIDPPTPGPGPDQAGFRWSIRQAGSIAQGPRAGGWVVVVETSEYRWQPRWIVRWYDATGKPTATRRIDDARAKTRAVELWLQRTLSVGIPPFFYVPFLLSRSAEAPFSNERSSLWLLLSAALFAASVWVLERTARRTGGGIPVRLAAIASAFLFGPWAAAALFFVRSPKLPPPLPPPDRSPLDIHEPELTGETR